jgi:predicted  nucleic acid-binding Zn-ribbon protein
MPMRVPDATKSLVMEQWILGANRDTIAADNGLSAGTVTNIVNERRAALGFARVDEVRELGIMLRRVGITPAQCALGFRTGMIMNKLGVKEDDFQSFIFDVYNRCKDEGLSPQNVAESLKDMVEFSKANAVPLSQISGHIKEKAEEIKRLEREIQNLRAQMNAHQEETKESDNRRALALYEEKMTSAQIKSYSDLLEEMKGLGLPIDDLSKFAKLVHGVSQRGFDVGKVINEFSDLDSMRKEYRSYQVGIPDLTKKLEELKGECYSVEQIISSHNQTLSVFRELEEMKFDLKVLKLLRNTVNEIASANKIPPEQATQKFCKDIDEQYDDKLGFELKLKQLRLETDSVTSSLTIARAILINQPVIGVSLQRLFAKGVQEHDIVDIANLFEKSNNEVDKQSLLGGLQKYRTLKTGIEKLNQEIELLAGQIFGLELDMQSLGDARQRIHLMIKQSKDVVALLQDQFNHAEEEEGNVKMLTMIYLLLQNLHVRQGGVEKLIDDSDSPNDPHGLKSAVIRGLSTMIAKLESKTGAGT